MTNAFSLVTHFCLICGKPHFPRTTARTVHKYYSYLGQDRNPICGHHHSSWWKRTTSCHRCAQMRCRSHRCHLRRWRGRHKGFPLHFLPLLTWLDGATKGKTVKLKCVVYLVHFTVYWTRSCANTFLQNSLVCIILGSGRRWWRNSIMKALAQHIWHQ